jgi:hypothetical protein
VASRSLTRCAFYRTRAFQRGHPSPHTYPFVRWDIGNAKHGGLAWLARHNFIYLCIQIY